MTTTTTTTTTMTKAATGARALRDGVREAAGRAQRAALALALCAAWALMPTEAFAHTLGEAMTRGGARGANANFAQAGANAFDAKFTRGFGGLYDLFFEYIGPIATRMIAAIFLIMAKQNRLEAQDAMKWAIIVGGVLNAPSLTGFFHFDKGGLF